MVFGVLATTLEHTAVIQADGEDSSMYYCIPCVNIRFTYKKALAGVCQVAV